MSSLLTLLILAAVGVPDAGVSSLDASASRKEALAACLKRCAAQANERAVETRGPALLDCLRRCELEPIEGQKKGGR